MALRTKSIVFFVCSLYWVMTGCSQKEYFQPQEVNGKYSFTNTLPATIVDIALQGATLENGNLITQDGLQDFKLAPNESFVGYEAGSIITSYACNTLRIYNKSYALTSEIELPSCPIGASIKGDQLTLITNENTIFVYELSSKKELFSKKHNTTLAVNSMIYPPVFFGNKVFFPMLDGNVIVLNLKNMEIERTIVVGTETYFNNIIFLEVKKDVMIAATSKRILSYFGGSDYSLDEEIRSIKVLNDRIYLTTLDGQIKELDLTLKPLRRLKFPFASLPLLLIKDGELYALEDGSGYLIKVRIKDFVPLIYKMDLSRGKNPFSQQNKIYYEKQYVEF
ncbi:hypothetical protein BBW65_02065 [Helicobacter enhydrae]|uniref:Plasminogen-binding protein n=1 Tax=Helicobacter enhydrae TaxID=222136 RepID=A0A1B1U4H2_9HELI|nr:hypothetical protein [Helicobacter enhydrae]ANV97663.1 hypothetical protein BBW65_02065 [Helicobacter enhydrae]